MKLRHIVWDWNGTLINDAYLCVDILNHHLQTHKKKKISLKFYRNNFFFPVSGFYKLIGLPARGKAFASISQSFITKYHQNFNRIRLQPFARSVLTEFSSINLSQSVLSAGKTNHVVHFLTKKKLLNFFENVSGSSNIKASGKIESAKSLCSSLSLHPSEVLLVGDTIHDYEIANEFGWQSVLLSNGHNSLYSLRNVSSPVLKNLSELPSLIRKYL